MIGDKIHDNAEMSCVSYFFPLFSPFSCEIGDSNEQVVRSEIISPKERVFLSSWHHFEPKRGCPIVFLPFNRC